MQEYKLFTEIMEHTKGAINAEDPNQSVIYSVGCLVWSWRQEHIKEPTSYYISSKRYDSLLEELTRCKDKIIVGDYSNEAEDQIKRAESWLENYLKCKVKHKNRVF